MNRVYDGNDYTGEVAAAREKAGADNEALHAGGALVSAILAKRA